MTRKKVATKVLDWTPNLAYVVGLLTTDGCLSNDGRHIIMRSSDIEQLENFKKCLGINNKIGKTFSANNTTCYRVQFGDIAFYRWLLTIGLTSNKSKVLGSVDIPDEFFVDFLRGHLDGDGSITTYTDVYNTKVNPSYIYKRLFVRFISASRKHIVWLHKKINQIIKINGKIYRYKSKKPNRADMFTIKIMKKDSLKLLSAIYYSMDLPTLSRKRKKYEKFISK